jgi:hypothetical protein
LEAMWFLVTNKRYRNRTVCSFFVTENIITKVR